VFERLYIVPKRGLFLPNQRPNKKQEKQRYLYLFHFTF